MMRVMGVALVFLTMAGGALADPIEGNWRTQAGSTAAIAPCGGEFCIKLTSGAHSGKSIGRMKASGGGYTGTVTDPAEDKTYSGSATVSGSSLKLTGCALKIFCRSQTWRKL
jgi:uncharacterized protein (DUF2147 family)